MALAAVLACSLSGCSHGGDKPHTASPKPPQIRDLAHIGAVLISHSPLLVIRDQSTQGRRFYLNGIQASECLSFLNANPAPSERDVRAACPGAIRKVPASKKQSSGSAGSP